MVRKYAAITELTPIIANELVKKFIARVPYKSSGHSMRNIQSVFDFAGELSVRKKFIPPDKRKFRRNISNSAEHTSLLIFVFKTVFFTESLFCDFHCSGVAVPVYGKIKCFHNKSKRYHGSVIF
ncbi:MAG: DUF4368 domain-containing protein [Clostridia bacterium]|nr:DUF4368 domain-containing protein [Clostridia bacterium]